MHIILTCERLHFLLLTPGEKISERCLRQIQFYLDEELEVHGLTREREIEIVWEEFFT